MYTLAAKLMYPVALSSTSFPASKPQCPHSRPSALHVSSGAAATVKLTKLSGDNSDQQETARESSASFYFQHSPGALGTPTPRTKKREHQPSLQLTATVPREGTTARIRKTVLSPNEGVKGYHEQGSRNLTRDPSQAFKQNRGWQRQRFLILIITPRSPMRTTYQKSQTSRG